MQDELLTYYNKELAFIRKMAKEFKGKYPGVAGNLLLEDNKSEDPHVERLLQGFAFLAGRIRRKLDDNFPEIVESLLSVLYPHYLAPVPSMSVVQFVPGSAPAKQTTVNPFPKHTSLYSQPVQGTPCRFRTCYPVDLWPIEVKSASVLRPDKRDGWPVGAEAVLTITLDAVDNRFADFINNDDPGAGLNALRFYIHGIEELPYQLYQLIFNNVTSLQVRLAAGTTDNGGAQTSVTKLPIECLHPVGFAEDEGLIDYPRQSFPGYRLLQEYFTFPQKFLFFEVNGLARAIASDSDHQLQLLFFLNEHPAFAADVNESNFLLGCTPIVNLFQKTAEPVRMDEHRTEYHVIPDLRRQPEMEVYSIDRVESSTPTSSSTGAKTYLPLYSYSHAVDDKDAGQFWSASRRPSERSGVEGTETFISLVGASNPATGQLHGDATLTVHTTCTNRNIPANMSFDKRARSDFEMDQGGDTIPAIKCLRQPTKSFHPPLGGETLWRLVSHLSLNYLSLIDEDEEPHALREILKLYDYQDSAFTQKQIMGILSIASKRVVRMVGTQHGGSTARGLRVIVEFDEDKYVGSGVFLLASVLERFFGLYVSINSFSEFVATTKQREASQRGPLRTWPPRAGKQPLL